MAVVTTAGLTLGIDYAPPVDNPPIITSTPAVAFTEGTPNSYDMTQHVFDDGQSPLSYALTNVLPGGLQFNGSSGILSYDGAGAPSISSHTLQATDAVGMAESAAFNINISAFLTLNDYFDLPGNVTDPQWAGGADATGVLDSTAAFQAVIDSPHFVIVPPGRYRILGTIYINQSKCIWCFGDSIRTFYGHATGSQWPFSLGEQVHFDIENNLNVFEVRAPIHWTGGMFWTGGITSPINNKIFYIPMDWTGGEVGGVIRNVSAFGDELWFDVNNTDGPQFVYIDCENYSVHGAKFENWRIQIEHRHIADGWRVTDYNPGIDQRVRGNWVSSDFRKSYRAILDPVSTDSHFTGMMQAKNGTYLRDTHPDYAASLAFNLTQSGIKVQGTNNIVHDPGLQDFFKSDLEEGRPASAINLGDGNFVTELKGQNATYDTIGDGGTWNMVNSVKRRNTGRLEPFEETTSALDNINSKANTYGKFPYKKVMLTNHRPRYALGGDPGDDWVDADGVVRHQPQ